MAIRWNLYIAAMLTCIIYFSPFGYQANILNNTEDLISTFVVDAVNERYHTTISEDQQSHLWATIVAILSVGRLFGSLVAPVLADRIGRKPTLVYISNPTGLAAGLMMLYAKSLNLPELLLVGRLIEGIRVGISATVVSTYIIESAPDDVRGAIGSIMDIAACFGVFVSFLVSMPHVFGTETGWPWLISVDIWLGIVGLIVTSVYLHESPKYLLSRRKYEKAAKAVVFFHGRDVDAQSQLQKYCMEDAIIHESMNKEVVKNLMTEDAFRRDLRIFIVSAVIGLLSPISGYVAVSSYSTPMLTRAGISKPTAAIYATIMGASELLGGMASVICNHLAPRRLVLLTVMALIFVYNVSSSVCLSLGSMFRTTFYGYALLHTGAICQLLLGTVAAMGPFPLMVIIPPELAPIRIRARAASICMCSLSIGHIIINFVTWPVYLKTGAWCFMVFAGLTLAAFVFLWFYLDETHPDFSRNRKVSYESSSAVSASKSSYGTFEDQEKERLH